MEAQSIGSSQQAVKHESSKALSDITSPQDGHIKPLCIVAGQVTILQEGLPLPSSLLKAGACCHVSISIAVDCYN
jgi:hypothetical protein